MFNNHLTKVCLAAVFAIGLAACSSSSDQAATPDPTEPPMATELDMLKEEIAALREQLGLDADDNLSDSITALQNEITRLEGLIQDAADAEAEAEAEAKRKAMAAAGKALHGALGTTPLGNLDRATNAGGASLGAAGLEVDQVQGTLAADPAAVTLEAGDSAGALGAWNGTNYAHTDGTTGTEVSNTAVVFTNQAAPMQRSLADAGITVHTADTAGDDIKGYYTVDESADLAKIMGAAFTHSGTQNHAYDSDNEVAFTTRGTFDGAPGEYRCTGTCSSTNDGEGSPSALAGTWHFKPDAGAMVAQIDTAYLYFGWWLRKDDDDPTSASAFFGEVGDVEGGGTLADLTAIAGTATYRGHAAGKFAINNPLGGSDAGHFTADVMLTAKFGSPTGTPAVADAGISGTIDNFMANEQSVPWSVALNRANWGAGGVFTSVAANNANAVAEATVWSIDGNASTESGSWNGQMHDEALAPATASDGSNVPTSAVGVFQSMFGSTHTMVGAFGATR